MAKKRLKNDENPAMLHEPEIGYGLAFNTGLASLIEHARQGLKYSRFSQLLTEIPFTFHEWSKYLHLSERTMQRYKTERKAFDPIYSDRILQIAILYKAGLDVFGSKENFDTWLETKCVALGGVKPKELLDNTFAIGLVKDELGRIEHGILA